MGLLDFFKKKKAIIETTGIDENQQVLNIFKAKLLEKGHQVEWHTQYLALVVNGELELSCLIIENPGNANVMHLMISASHLQYFPNGIIENVAGFGTSPEERVNATLDNYIDSTFDTIIYGLSDTHDPELDFMTSEILWHPKVGCFIALGQWEEYPPEDSFFNLLKSKIPSQLTSDKISWLKIYIFKKEDGEIIGECLFNNKHWQEGFTEISNYAKSWELPGEFHGLKQFIIFRRCDAYDGVND